MKKPTMVQVMSSLAILVGGLASIVDLLAAFGVDLTDQQTGAISGVANLALLVLGVYFHPNIPVGRTDGGNTTAPTNP